MPTPQVMACVRCGAELRETARWCPVCYRRVLDVDGNELLEELHRLSTDLGWWVPPKNLTRPAPPPAYSRLRAGPFSFGPWGRVGMTLLILAILYVPYSVITAGHVAIDVVGTVVLLAFASIPLRHVWGRHRIR